MWQWLKNILSGLVESEVPAAEDILPAEECGTCNLGEEACHTCPFLQWQ